METCPLDLTACTRPECGSGVCTRTGENIIAQCWSCGWLQFGGKGVVVCERCHARANDRPRAVARGSGER